MAKQQTIESHKLFLIFLSQLFVKIKTGSSTKRSLSQRFRKYADTKKNISKPVNMMNLEVTETGRIHNGYIKQAPTQDKKNNILYWVM